MGSEAPQTGLLTGGIADAKAPRKTRAWPRSPRKSSPPTGFPKKNMQRVLNALGREPNLVELGIFLGDVVRALQL
jgi:hypothetical protein